MAQLTLSQYYSLLKNYLSVLKETTDISSVQSQVVILEKIIDIGFKVEKESDTNKMKQYSIQIQNLSKGIGYVCDVPSAQESNKVHQYNLPIKINNNTELLFSLIYLKHLLNYQKVIYQGVITSIFVTPFITNGINSDKPWHMAQALFLEQKIKDYCSTNKINYSQIYSQVISDDEDFIKKIHHILTNKDISVVDTKDSMDYVSLQKKAYEDKVNSIDDFENFSQNSLLLEQAKKELDRLESQYQEENLNKKLINVFFSNSTGRKLTQAARTVLALEKKLEIPHGKTVKQYYSELLDRKVKAENKYTEIVYQASKKTGKNNPLISCINQSQCAEASNTQQPPLSTISSPCIKFFEEKLPEPSDIEDYLFEERDYETALLVAGVSVGVVAAYYAFS